MGTHEDLMTSVGILSKTLTTTKESHSALNASYVTIEVKTNKMSKICLLQKLIRNNTLEKSFAVLAMCAVVDHGLV